MQETLVPWGLSWYSSNMFCNFKVLFTTTLMIQCTALKQTLTLVNLLYSDVMMMCCISTGTLKQYFITIYLFNLTELRSGYRPIPTSVQTLRYRYKSEIDLLVTVGHRCRRTEVCPERVVSKLPVKTQR